MWAQPATVARQSSAADIRDTAHEMRPVTIVLVLETGIRRTIYGYVLDYHYNNDERK